ncbi:MAG: hypothetical protein HQK95_03325 [Nitrospirae bacterium]|nr:hypothetical protein [Nitrospirota bacterium]
MRIYVLIAVMAILCLSVASVGAQENAAQWNCFQKIHEKALTTAIALTPTRLRYALIPFYDSMIDELYKTEYKPTAYQDKKVFDNLYEAAVFEAHKRNDLKKDYFARLMTDLTMYVIQKYYPGRLGGFCEEWTFLRYAPVFYGGYDGGDKKPDFTRYSPVIYGGYEKKRLYADFKNVFFSDNFTDSPIRYTGDMLWYYNKTVNEIVNLWIAVWKDADRKADSVIETYTLVNPEDVTPFNQKAPKINKKGDDLGLEPKNKPVAFPYVGYRAVYEVRDDDAVFVLWENSKLERPEDYTEIYNTSNHGLFLFRQRYKLIKPLRVFSSMANARDYAFNAIDNKKYYEAAAIFGTLIDRKSADPDMYYGLGLALFNIDDYINSLINFSKAGAHGGSPYYVGLISEYLARKASSFEQKMTLLADSARAYEQYGTMGNVPEAIEKSKAVSIDALLQYEKEMESVISDTMSTSMEALQKYEKEKGTAAEQGIDKNVKLTRLEAQAKLARLIDLNDQYQLVATGLNERYPDAYNQKNYDQEINDIKRHVDVAVGIDVEIAGEQERANFAEKKAAKELAASPEYQREQCKQRCVETAFQLGLKLNTVGWERTINGRAFINCKANCD